MNNNYTHITYVLDRSGSMHSVHQETKDALVEFINGQKELEGKCTFSLYQFDYEVLNPINFSLIADVNAEEIEFVPRGSTSLYDAVGQAVSETGNHLNSLDEADKPAKVLVVIQTDGHENTSVEFTAEQISEIIKHQQEKYNWQFIFLGANQNAVLTARTMNVANSISYSNNAAGIARSNQVLSAAAATYRSSASETASLNIGDQDLR